MGFARRQARRRGLATAAVTASAISSARTNRARRRAINAQTDMMEQELQTQPSATTTSVVGQSTQVVSNDATEQLINLKKLLDQGIITQEEFDSKKKQLLGL